MAEEGVGGDLLTEVTRENVDAVYRRANLRKVLFILGFVVLAVFSVFFTLAFGVYDISFRHTFEVFFDHITGNIVDQTGDLYIWDTRLPRAIGAIVAGAGLSVAGVIMQNNFRNPLAEPYTMGISSGAFLGAVLSITRDISLIPGVSEEYMTTVNAFICSLLPIFIILLVSKFRRLSPTMMILVGLAVMYLFSAICDVIMVTSESETLAEAYNWRIGTLAKVDWDNLPVMTAVTVVACIALYSLWKRLDIMYAGDRSTQTLGENPNVLRLVTLVVASFMVAAIVSTTGTIGFIGLVGPHVARVFVGSSNKYLIPASAAFGAAFILLADTVAKVSGVNGLPVGVISSLVGGPLFLYILIKQRRRVWMRCDFCSYSDKDVWYRLMITIRCARHPVGLGQNIYPTPEFRNSLNLLG